MLLDQTTVEIPRVRSRRGKHRRTLMMSITARLRAIGEFIEEYAP